MRNLLLLPENGVFRNKPVWVVLPNAGIGKRLGSTIPKQYLEVQGKTIIEWTLDVFLKLDYVDGIVVVNHYEDSKWESTNYVGSIPVITVEGGEDRFNSVLNGCKHVKEIAPEDTWVLVHDVARPLVTAQAIYKLVDTCLRDNNAGILANQVSDTIKIVVNGKIQETVSRELLWQAQTPQFFPLRKLLSAMKYALSLNLQLTDESSAFEQLGYVVNVIESPKSNIKVTHPEDLGFVEFIKSSVDK